MTLKKSFIVIRNQHKQGRCKVIRVQPLSESPPVWRYRLYVPPELEHARKFNCRPHGLALVVIMVSPSKAQAVVVAVASNVTGL